MKQRISDKELIRLREFCRQSTGVEQSAFRITDELVEAREEIKRLKALSESQEAKP